MDIKITQHLDNGYAIFIDGCYEQSCRWIDDVIKFVNKRIEEEYGGKMNVISI